MSLIMLITVTQAVTCLSLSEDVFLKFMLSARCCDKSVYWSSFTWSYFSARLKEQQITVLWNFNKYNIIHRLAPPTSAGPYAASVAAWPVECDAAAPNRQNISAVKMATSEPVRDTRECWKIRSTCTGMWAAFGSDSEFSPRWNAAYYPRQQCVF